MWYPRRVQGVGAARLAAGDRRFGHPVPAASEAIHRASGGVPAAAWVTSSRQPS